MRRVVRDHRVTVVSGGHTVVDELWANACLPRSQSCCGRIAGVALERVSVSVLDRYNQEVAMLAVAST